MNKAAIFSYIFFFVSYFSFFLDSVFKTINNRNYFENIMFKKQWSVYFVFFLSDSYLSPSEKTM